MKKYLVLFVCLFSAVVFADDSSGSFDVTNLFNDVSALIVSLVVSVGILLTSAATVYLIYLGWDKYKEACYHVASDNEDVEWLADNDEWIRNHGFIPLEDKYDEDGNYIGASFQSLCEEGYPCPHSDECEFWSGNQCGLGME